MEEQTTQVAEQPVVKAKNGLGLAGFIIAIVGLVLCWIPILGTLLLFVAWVLSVIGLIIGIVKKKKIVLAIIGLALSTIGYIVAAVVLASVTSMF